MALALGVEQVDGGLGLGGQEPADHAAVGGGDRVLDEIALDGSARVEDVDQQLVAGQGGHAREVGPNLAALIAVSVALGALLREDELARGGVSALIDLGRDGVDHVLAVGVGKAAALLEQSAGASGDRGVGMGGQGLLLVQLQLGEAELTLLQGGHQGRGPVGATE